MGLLKKVDSLTSNAGKGLLRTSIETLAEPEPDDVEDESPNAQEISEQVVAIVSTPVEDHSESRAAVSRKPDTAEPQDSDTTDRNDTEPLLPLQAALKNIKSLPGGIDSPAFLFGILKNFLELEKGCLLVLDNDGRHYIPCAAAGWAEGSFSEFRIPRSDIEDIARAPAVTRLDAVTPDHIRSLLPQPSDYQMETVTVKPIIDSENLLAVFVVIDGPESSIPDIEEVIKGEALALMLSRRELMDRIMPAPVKALSELGANKPVLSVTYHHIIEELKVENPLLNAVWHEQDMACVLRHVLGCTGELFTDRAGRFYLLKDEGGDVDMELLVHQSYVALKTYFRATKTPLSLRIAAESSPSPALSAPR